MKVSLNNSLKGGGYKSVMRKKVNIALDLDGVIANTGDIIEKEIRERGYVAHYETYNPVILGEDKDSTSKIVNDVVIDIFRNKMDQVLPYGGEHMNNVFKELDIVANITIVTARDREFDEKTKQWWKKHFPETEVDFVYLSSTEKSQYIKDEGFLCFVEDRLRTANEAARLGINTYLINRRWNMGRRTHENIVRITEFSTFQSLLVSRLILPVYVPTKNKKNKDLLGC